MEQNVLIAIVAAILLAIAMFIITKVLKTKKQNELITKIQLGDFEGFHKVANSFLIKMLFPRYNIEYLKLNAFILEGDESKITGQFDHLMSARKNKAQTEDITMKAFNYYVGIEDKVKCKQLIETINTFTNERMVQEANIMYDVFILKKGNHIDEMLASLDALTDAQKGVNEYLLSVQYNNIGDKENAKKYEKLSKKHLNQTGK